MKSQFRATSLLVALMGAAACGKKHDQRNEVVECSSISLDAKGTTQCLVTLYHWKVADATKAANARVAELDSLKGWRDNSLWSLDAAKHRRDLQTCMAKRDFNLSSCLTLYYKWDSDRALATADSVTRARLGR